MKKILGLMFLLVANVAIADICYVSDPKVTSCESVQIRKQVSPTTNVQILSFHNDYVLFKGVASKTQLSKGQEDEVVKYAFGRLSEDTYVLGSAPCKLFLGLTDENNTLEFNNARLNFVGADKESACGKNLILYNVLTSKRWYQVGQ